MTQLALARVAGVIRVVLPEVAAWRGEQRA
jgi:hypothetical protein